MAGDEGGRVTGGGETEADIRTFLIADVRGYTLFTQERGDEQAGKLAAKFARLVREAVEVRGGRLLELRGDEALCVFTSPRQAIRTSVELQERFVEETLADPDLPLTVGIGLDAGEAVAVEGGYRGGALNLAARLCGQARAGEILASREVAHLARRVEGVRYEDRGALTLKGLAEPVQVVRVGTEGVDAMERLTPYAPARAPTPTRRRRPGPVAIVIAAVLALLLVAVAIPLLRSGPDVPVGSNSVARLAAGDARVELATPLGERLGASAVGFGSLWVAEPDRARVVRVDLGDGEVVDTIEVGRSPAGVAVGGGSVWVTNAGDGTVTRIDPETNFPNPPFAAGSRPTGLAFGGGALWVADALGGELLRIDPSSGATSRKEPLPGQPAGVAFTDRGVWVTMAPSDLVRLDPESLDVTLTKAVGSGPTAVLPAFGAIWVANRFDGTVSRLDPSTGTVLSTDVGDGPSALAAAAGSVWVTTEYDGTVTELDAETLTRERTLPVGPALASVVADGDALWLAGGASPTEHLGGTLRVASSSNEAPTTLDPAVAYATPLALQILPHTNDGVLDFEKVGGPTGTTLVPDLASAFPEVSPDGLTYRFTLREGIRYSTGEPVRPEDFRHGLERSLALSFDAAGLFAAIEGADGCDQEQATCDLSDGIVTGDGSVTYHLARPDADLPFKLALPFAYPLPASVPFEDQKLDPVPATGPYRIASASAGTIELERNPEFHRWSGAAQPNGFVDRITWTVGMKPERALDALAVGSLDWFNDPPPSEELAALDRAHPDQVVDAPLAVTYFVGFDLTLPPFDDVEVRQAVNYAIDRGHVVDLLGGPTLQRATCQIIPPNFAGYERFCPYTLAPERDEWSAPDIHRARALVRAAGAVGERIRVWVSGTPGTVPPGSLATMRYVTDVLRDLRLRPELRILPADTYFPTIYAWPPPGAPDAPHVYLSGWASDYPGGGDFIDSQFRCGAGGNASGLCDRRLDRRIAEAKELQLDDLAAANRAWTLIEHDLVEDAVWAPLANPVATYAFSARTENVQIHPLWGPLLSRMWV